MGKKKVRAARGTLLYGVNSFCGNDYEVFLEFVKKMAGHYSYDTHHRLTLDLARLCPSAEQEKQWKEDPNDTSRLPQAKRDYQKWLSILHYRYRIPLKHFADSRRLMGEDTKAEETPGDFDAFNISKNLPEAYKQVKDGPYSELSTQLWILDYLERQHHSKGVSLKAYLENDKAYFVKVYEAFEKNPEAFDYLRLLSLPLDYTYRGKSEKDIIRDALDHLSFPLFKHLCDFIVDFGESMDQRTGPCGFFVISRKVGLLHYAIINGGEYVIKEEYSYNDKKELLAELLFIDKQSNPTQVIYKKYRKQVKELLKEPGTLVLNDLQQIHSCIKGLWEKMQSQGVSGFSSKDQQIEKNHLVITKLKFDYIDSIIKSME